MVLFVAEDESVKPKRVRVRTSKYLNNRIEQDHRRVKQRLRRCGVEELPNGGGCHRWHRTGGEKIKKGQFKIGKLGGNTATMPEIWQAALAA
ncbi:MAG: hypothetical protein M3Y72_26950 [Acidobacteriota bacterium]|nr:hypothetical protein [Acidobacteriota bacterium]